MSKYTLYSHECNSYVTNVWSSNDGRKGIAFANSKDKARYFSNLAYAVDTRDITDKLFPGLALEIRRYSEITPGFPPVGFGAVIVTEYPRKPVETDIYEKMIKDRIEKLESENEKLESENEKLKETISNIRKELEL